MRRRMVGRMTLAITGSLALAVTGMQPSGGAEEPASAPTTAAARGWIDTSSRSAVTAAYNAVYDAAMPATGWTGSISSCQEGTLSSAYRGAVMSRVNWFRAMAGVLDGVVENSSFSSDAQAAALMMAANDSLSHDPPTGWACYSSAGDFGASKSNLAIGNVASVEGFMTDPGAGNTAVGHRWWILHPTQVRMGVGATTGAEWHDQTLALYVVDDANLFPPTPPPVREPSRFVSWPPRGFVPSNAVYPRWSLFHDAADFTAASVQVSVNGVNKAVTIEHRDQGRMTFVPTLDAFPANGDVPVVVNVSGITGSGVPASYSWTTTVIPPPPPASAQPKIYVGDVRLAEGASGSRAVYFPVTLSKPAATPVTFNYATANSTALQPGDYTTRTGSLTIPAGAVSTSVSVAVRGDTTDEPDETFRLALSNVTGATVGDGSGGATIADDDPSSGVRLTIGDVSIYEGASGSRTARVTVSLSQAAASTVTVNFATANSSAVQPSDYLAASGTLTFSPGVLTQSVSVKVNGDTAAEANEQLQVKLSGASGATVGDGIGVVTVRNDD